MKNEIHITTDHKPETAKEVTLRFEIITLRMAIAIKQLFEKMRTEAADILEQIRITNEKNNRRPGRPLYQEDIWAIEEMRKGRDSKEVRKEWFEKIDMSIRDKNDYGTVNLKRHFRRLKNKV